MLISIKYILNGNHRSHGLKICFSREDLIIDSAGHVKTQDHFLHIFFILGLLVPAGSISPNQKPREGLTVAINS